MSSFQSRFRRLRRRPDCRTVGQTNLDENLLLARRRTHRKSQQKVWQNWPMLHGTFSCIKKNIRSAENGVFYSYKSNWYRWVSPLLWRAKKGRDPTRKEKRRHYNKRRKCGREGEGKVEEGEKRDIVIITTPPPLRPPPRQKKRDGTSLPFPLLSPTLLPKISPTQGLYMAICYWKNSFCDVAHFPMLLLKINLESWWKQ